MEINDKLTKILLQTPSLKDNLCKLINDEQFDELVQLPNDVTLSLTAFVSTFINEIHGQTQWLLKDGPDSEAQRKTPASNAKSQNNKTTPTGGASPKKHASNDEKRQRPRVKLFSSPLRPENSPSPGFSASTPKHHNRSNNSSESLASPLWPNAHSPSAQQPRTTSSPGSGHEDSWSRRLKLSLGDFVVKDMNTPKGKNRRIKPTKITPDASRLLPTDGPFALESPVSEKSCSIEERIITKMDAVMLVNLSEEQKEVTKSETNDSSSVKEPVSKSEQTRLVRPISVPAVYDVKSITHQEGLETLAEIFALILCKNACENIMTELYFLANLIIANNPETVAKSPPLNTYNNCAYFAVKTFINIEPIISLLTSTTLGLLAAQPAVAEFASSFKTQLENLSRTKLNKSTNLIHVPQGGNVSFQCDTDNVENFTSHLNFSSFRKQRDAFYNLLQLWEKTHNDNEFHFKNSLAQKARAILTIKDDPTNILHLARLFRNQLLASCAVQSGSLDEAGEEVLELLPTADRDRLSRLQARLSEPRTSRGPVPKPDFPGRQMFFKDFIIACGPGMFNHFLQLCLVDELLKLNDFEFSSEGCDSFADDLTQKRYLECVSSTKLLAKFLAFAEFLPYRTGENLSEQVVNLHCATRQKVLPLFDLDCCLKDAVANHRLVLTLPWIVAYLSLMDAASVRLPVYVKVWQHLSWLRRSLPKYITAFGRFMLQLSLGWLFQVVQLSELTEEALNFPEGVQDLDDIDVVTDVVLNYVCPFLNELNAILTGSSTHPARHIRPTPTKPSGDRVKQMELRLEESFLQNQSQSTRRSIQFVTERVASCCIKEMANEILPEIRKKIKEEYTKLSKNPQFRISTLLDTWEAEVNSVKNSKTLEVCKTRCTQSLRGLLWKDVDETVMSSAIALATRQSLEKVQNWLQTNSLDNEENMKSFLKAPDEIKESDQRPDFLPECLNVLRNVIIKTSLGNLTEDELIYALDLTQSIVTTQLLPAPTERGILCMLVEILTELANSSIEIESWKRLAHIIRLTNPHNHPSNPLERIFCARNMQFPTRRLMRLPIFLVEENLIPLNDALKQAKKCDTEGLTQDIKDELRNTINVLEQKIS